MVISLSPDGQWITIYTILLTSLLAKYSYLTSVLGSGSRHTTSSWHAMIFRMDRIYSPLITLHYSPLNSPSTFLLSSITFVYLMLNLIEYNTHNHSQIFIAVTEVDNELAGSVYVSESPTNKYQYNVSKLYIVYRLLGFTVRFSSCTAYA